MSANGGATKLGSDMAGESARIARLPLALVDEENGCVGKVVLD